MISKRVLVPVLAITLLVLSMVNFASAISGKIENARVVLYPEVGFWGNTLDRTILVINDNDVPINIKLEADENFSKMVNIIDKNFVLQPGEEKEARLAIKIKKAGSYDGKIFVYFNPIGGDRAGIILASLFIIRARDKGEGYSDDNADTGYADNLEGDNNSNITMTENVVKDSSNLIDRKMVIVFSISTLILAVALIFLLVLNKKKKEREGKLKKKRVNDRKV